MTYIWYCVIKLHCYSIFLPSYAMWYLPLLGWSVSTASPLAVSPPLILLAHLLTLLTSRVWSPYTFFSLLWMAAALSPSKTKNSITALCFLHISAWAAILEMEFWEWREHTTPNSWSQWSKLMVEYVFQIWNKSA